VTEYLFRKPALLDEVIRIAIEDNTFRSDDLEFTFAARVSPVVLSIIFPLSDI
jgi:prephenate dehydrogenase (NADP+)